MKLKDLKKIHEMEQEAFEQKCKSGLVFFKELVKEAVKAIPNRPTTVGEPIHETPEADPDETIKFQALFNTYFTLAGAGMVECVGRNLCLQVQDYNLFMSSKEHPNFSLKIDSLDKIHSAKLENLIEFVRNA